MQTPLFRGLIRELEAELGEHTVPSCGGIYNSSKNPSLVAPEVFQSPRSAGSHSKIMESRTEWCVISYVRQYFWLKMIHLGEKCFIGNK